MIKANAELRQYMKSKEVFYWELAAELNIAESTLIRWLRIEMSPDKKSTLMKKVDRIVNNRNKAV